MTRNEQPRRKTSRVLLWSCLLVAVLATAAVIGPLIYVYVAHGVRAHRLNQYNLKAVKPLLDALESHRRVNGHYPKSLCELPLTQRPVLDENTHVRFTVSEDGTEFFLAIFPWREATLMMPSDEAYEYSSSSGEWEEMDESKTTAKDDPCFGWHRWLR